jgi:hypothetical protein
MLGAVADRRSPRGKIYGLVFVLATALVAVLAGATNFQGMIWMPGCCCSHAASASEVACGNRSTGRRVAMSTRIVPYLRPLPNAHSSTPMICNGPISRSGKARMSRKSVAAQVIRLWHGKSEARDGG